MARLANWVDVSGDQNRNTHLYGGPGLFVRPLTAEDGMKRLEKQNRNNLPERDIVFTPPMPQPKQ